MHEGKRKGGKPQRSDRSTRETNDFPKKKKKIRKKQTTKQNVTIPLQSCSLLYYNTHVHAHTQKKQWEKVWELLLPHCWWQVGKIIWKHSELAKASTSILKLSKKWEGGGEGVKISPGHLVVRLHCGLSYGWTEETTQGSNIQKTASNLPTEVVDYFTIWLFASSFKSCNVSLKCLLFQSFSGCKNCTFRREINEAIRGNGLRLKIIWSRCERWVKRKSTQVEWGEFKGWV